MPGLDSKARKSSNATHVSTTDAQAKLVRIGPGKEGGPLVCRSRLDENATACACCLSASAVGAPESQVASSRRWSCATAVSSEDQRLPDKAIHEVFRSGHARTGLVPRPRSRPAEDAAVVCTARARREPARRKRIEEIFADEDHRVLRKTLLRCERSKAHGQFVVARGFWCGGETHNERPSGFWRGVTPPARCVPHTAHGP